MFLKAYDLAFVNYFLHKNLFFSFFFFLQVAHHTEPFSVHKLGPKIAIFRGFTNIFFFRTTGLQLKFY